MVKDDGGVGGGGAKETLLMILLNHDEFSVVIALRTHSLESSVAQRVIRTRSPPPQDHSVPSNQAHASHGSVMVVSPVTSSISSVMSLTESSMASSSGMTHWPSEARTTSPEGQVFAVSSSVTSSSG